MDLRGSSHPNRPFAHLTLAEWNNLTNVCTGGIKDRKAENLSSTCPTKATQASCQSEFATAAPSRRCAESRQDPFTIRHSKVPRVCGQGRSAVARLGPVVARSRSVPRRRPAKCFAQLRNTDPTKLNLTTSKIRQSVTLACCCSVKAGLSLPRHPRRQR
jgi:hypothetical protein